MVNDVFYTRAALRPGIRLLMIFAALASCWSALSPAMQADERSKKFMYDRLYYHPEQQLTAERSAVVAACLS
jgi:dGTPase